MNAALPERAHLLARMRADTPSVLSVYFTLPVDPAEGARGLPARLTDLLADATAAAGAEPDHYRRRRLRADLSRVRAFLVAQAPKWIGHGLAVFAAGELGLFDVLRLPGPVPDRAVLGTCPHLLPLLSTIQRNPPYAIVVVERRNAWLYHVRDGSIRLQRRVRDEAPRSRSFAGWRGLEEYRARDHANELRRQHFRRTIDALAGMLRRDPCDFVVIGGHTDGIAEFRGMLPHGVQDMVAGTFHVDPHTMRTAEVRAHTAEIVAGRVGTREATAVGDALARPAGSLMVTGLSGCLDAAAGGAVDTLFVADDLRRAGRVCVSCRAPSTSAGRCRSCGEDTRPVPDVVDELVARVLVDSGTVETTDTPEGPIARLRHPVTGSAALSLSAG